MAENVLFAYCTTPPPHTHIHLPPFFYFAFLVSVALQIPVFLEFDFLSERSFPQVTCVSFLEI